MKMGVDFCSGLKLNGVLLINYTGSVDSTAIAIKYGLGVKTVPIVNCVMLAAETGLFPLLKIKNGLDWRLTYKPERLKPLKEYLLPQGRFKHLSDEELLFVQDDVFKNWDS